MQDKKYYSVGEVTKILNIHSHQVRYLELVVPNLVIHKIRNRRHYTNDNIKNLRDYIIAKNIIKSEKTIVAKLSDSQINRINCLIQNFRILSINIQKIIVNPS